MSHTFTTEIRVRYVETDQMGFAHHSNYLHWFEVARTEWIRAFYKSYRLLEEEGVLLPLTGCALQYKQSAKYEDLLQITAWIESYNKVRMTFAYEVIRDGEVITTGTTDHAFITRDGSIVRLDRSHPEFHEVILSQFGSER
jgi:acyl-CoA thioester hydrolase